MLQTTIVRLRRPTRVAQCVARGLGLSKGDACVVRSERGLEFGLCITDPEECDESAAEKIPAVVVRKAGIGDETTFRQILADEEKAKGVCLDKIVHYALPMRLVDAEYTFDRHKVVFSFTADARVDFRELVRDLAHELKTRIELRHIQVRDKAKIVGALAACGRQLCCATWLKEFAPISMKMAKRQNLSLNPTKISGQCGRLMCCLSYEDNSYGGRKKRGTMPRMESDVPDDMELEEEENEAANGVSEEALLEVAEERGEAIVLMSADDEMPESENEDDEGRPGDGNASSGGDREASRRPRKRRRRRSQGGGGGGTSAPTRR